MTAFSYLLATMIILISYLSNMIFSRLSMQISQWARYSIQVQLRLYWVKLLRTLTWGSFSNCPPRHIRTGWKWWLVRIKLGKSSPENGFETLYRQHQRRVNALLLLYVLGVIAIVRIQSVSFLRKGVGPLFFSFTLICPGEIRKFLHFRGSTTCYVNWRQVKVYMMRGQGIFFIKSQLNQK